MRPAGLGPHVSPQMGRLPEDEVRSLIAYLRGKEQAPLP